MRPVLLLCVSLFFFLLSCNISKKGAQEGNKVADSLEQIRIQEREKQVADSLKQAARYEMAITAYGELKFGMEKDTVSRIMARTMKNGNARTLGGYDYLFSPVYNEKGQLYMLRVHSPSESALQLESSVRMKMENLRKILVTRYGEPKESHGFPDDFDLVETRIRWTAVWEYDTKTIKVGVESLPEEGSRYRAVCWIYDDPYRVMERKEGKENPRTKIEAAASDF